jgi:ribosomal protein S18 acetylase RimI-like enzyme
MDLIYRWTCEGVNWEEVVALLAAAGLRGRAGDKVRRAYLNSQLVCFAYGGARLVGTARALTDWEYHALIYDVAVHPAYQRQGIGGQMMRALLARLKVWRIMLVSDEVEGQRFYRRLGFEGYDNVMARLDWANLYDPET